MMSMEFPSEWERVKEGIRSAEGPDPVEEGMASRLWECLASTLGKSGGTPRNAESVLMEEIVCLRMTAWRLERTLRADGLFPVRKEGGITGPVHSWVDALAKTRERYRKAMKEFMEQVEGEVAKSGGGLAKLVAPMLKKGQHGAPSHGVFDLDDYLACVDEDMDFVEEVLSEEDAFDAPEGLARGAYYLGCDLGYARDPSEFVVYRAEGTHLVNVARFRLEGVNYARQQANMAELDRAYDFRAVGIDSGNNGRAVAHALMAEGVAWGKKITAIEFGSVIDLGDLPDGSPRRRPVKEFMTELLRRAMADRSLILPKSPEREAQYASHTYTVGHQGRIVFDKGNDHIIDADRCAMLCHYLDMNIVEQPRLGVRIEGF